MKRLRRRKLERYTLPVPTPYTTEIPCRGGSGPDPGLEDVPHKALRSTCPASLSVARGVCKASSKAGTHLRVMGSSAYSPGYVYC